MLTEKQLKRYKRQLILREIDVEGQKKLFTSKVLVVGAGGLGSPVIMYLAAAGVGNIGIIDHDVIDISNLQRQVIHTTENIGVSKVTSAKIFVKKLNDDTCIEEHKCKLTIENINEIIKKYDVVINAVDNVETRYLLNKNCVKLKIPYVEGGIFNFEGQVMTILPGESACYNCIFPETTSNKIDNNEIGVMGVLPGVIGSLQAMEAIKILLGIGKTLNNKILFYNSLNASFKEIKVKRNENCSICSTYK